MNTISAYTWVVYDAICLGCIIFVGLIETHLVCNLLHPMLGNNFYSTTAVGLSYQL